MPGGVPSPEEAEPRRRRRQLAALAGVLLAGCASVAAVLLATGSSPRLRLGTGVPAGETTALVTRRTLSESATVEGTLGYDGERVIYDRLAGTFTWLPAVGARVGRGGVLFRIDNRPVVLMYGAVPAYRTLKSGVSRGPDVSELNENLIALGYDPYGAIAHGDAFSDATSAAVRRWQHAEGLLQTGRVELGRIIFAPGPQRVTALKVSLGQDPPEASPAAPTAHAGENDKASQDAQARKPKKKHKPSTAKKRKSKEPNSSKAGSPEGSSPSRASNTPKSEAPASGGEDQAAGGGEQALSTTATQQIVELKVKPEQQRLAHLGERVRVLLPGESTVPGRITGVGTVASSSQENPEAERGGAGSEPKLTVTVTLERSVSHLDEAPVSVELLKSIRRNVLTGPATALIATAGGGYAVEDLRQGRRTPVAVIPGMFSDGYVQIEGPRIREGMTVIESE